MLVKNGDKSTEAETTLVFKEDSLTASPQKDKFDAQEKAFAYKNIKAADYSFARKPLLSTGGTITSDVLLGLVALPLLSMKKKRHWLSVRTDKDFAVLKLQGTNYRQIIAEFEKRG